MHVLNHYAIEPMVEKLKYSGWKGDTDAFIMMLNAANQVAIDSVFNKLEVISDDYTRCLGFIYKRTSMIDSFCELHVFKDIAIFIDRKDSHGGSLDNNFDKAFHAFNKAFPVSNLDEMKIVHKGDYGFHHVVKDGENWYINNLDFGLEEALFEIKKHKVKQ